MVLTVPFGVFRVGEQQRVYGSAALQVLLEDFTVEQKRCYKFTEQPGADNNAWCEVPEAEAAQVDSPDRTTAVCLIKARKDRA